MKQNKLLTSQDLLSDVPFIKRGRVVKVLLGNGSKRLARVFQVFLHNGNAIKINLDWYQSNKISMIHTDSLIPNRDPIEIEAIDEITDELDLRKFVMIDEE